MNGKANNLKLLTQLLKGTRNMYACKNKCENAVKQILFFNLRFLHLYYFLHVKLHIIYAPLHGHGILLIKKKQMEKIEW